MIKDTDNTLKVLAALELGVSHGVVSLANNVEERIDSGFDTGQDALGRGWTPLAPETIRKKGHSQILVDKGDMRDSVNTQYDSSSHTASVGFEDGTIRYHEFGVPENNLPARPVLNPAIEYASSGIQYEIMAESMAMAFGAI